MCTRSTKEKTNQNGKRGKRDDGHAVTYEIAYAGEAQRGTRDTTDMRAFIDVFVTYNELVMMVVSGEKGLEYLNRASQSLDISTQRIWSISSQHTSVVLILKALISQHSVSGVSQVSIRQSSSFSKP